MHNEESERPVDRDDDLREAVTAADDTGLVRQQEVIVVTEMGDSPAGDPERAI